MIMKNRIWYWVYGLLLALIVSALSACSTDTPEEASVPAPPKMEQKAKPVIYDLAPEAVHEFLQDNPRSLVLDVRTPAEYNGEGGHVAGAILRPVQDIESWVSEYSDYKTRPVYLICGSGKRSMRAANRLLEAGFQKPINVTGGMRAWTEADLPVVTE